MKLKLYMSSRQIEYQQQVEIYMVVLKNAFGSPDEKNAKADIINEKIKSLPTMNDRSNIEAFFKRNNS